MPDASNDPLAELQAAILADDLDAVDRLLRRDATLTRQGFSIPTLYDDSFVHWIYAGDTALHLAAAAHRAKVVQKLIARGADPNAALSRRRATPLHYAADGFPNSPSWDPDAQVSTIRTLLHHGSNPNAQDANGATPLHRAVRTRCPGAVATFLDAGADPLVPNNSGSTPFHLAVQSTGRGGSGSQASIRAQREIIEQFLRAGLSPSLRGAGSKTVAESARSAWVQALLAPPS